MNADKYCIGMESVCIGGSMTVLDDFAVELDWATALLMGPICHFSLIKENLELSHIIGNEESEMTNDK